MNCEVCGEVVCQPNYTAMGWSSPGPAVTVHEDCDYRRISSAEQQKFHGLFIQAGFPLAIMHPVPNGYTRETTVPKHSPQSWVRTGSDWYVVDTGLGLIEIGWRKHVINIDWGLTGKDLLSVFKKEDVTKDKYYIHAWGYDKCLEYLKTIRSRL